MTDFDGNPYQPVPATEQSHTVTGLTCPYCTHAYKLTRIFYYLGSTSTHHCAKCNKQSQLRRDARHWMRFIGETTLQVASAFIVMGAAFYFVGLAASVATGLICLVLGLEYDRWCDSRRKLEPLEAVG